MRHCRGRLWDRPRVEDALGPIVRGPYAKYGSVAIYTHLRLKPTFECDSSDTLPGMRSDAAHSKDVVTRIQTTVTRSTSETVQDICPGAPGLGSVTVSQSSNPADSYCRAHASV